MASHIVTWRHISLRHAAMCSICGVTFKYKASLTVSITASHGVTWRHMASHIVSHGVTSSYVWEGLHRSGRVTHFRVHQNYKVFISFKTSNWHILLNVYKVGPSGKGGLFYICTGFGFLFLVRFSQSDSAYVGERMRGRQNLCLQKSRMPLAGLVYLGHSKLYLCFS